MKLAFAILVIIAPALFFMSNTTQTGIHSQPISISKNHFSTSQIPQNVVFCDLIKDAAAHENKLVRVRASLISNFESSMLYDSGCKDKDTLVELTMDCLSDESCKEMQQLLGKGLKGDPFSGMRADLLMVGRLSNEKSLLANAPGRGAITFKVSKIEEVFQTRENSIP